MLIRNDGTTVLLSSFYSYFIKVVRNINHFFAVAFYAYFIVVKISKKAATGIGAWVFKGAVSDDFYAAAFGKCRLQIGYFFKLKNSAYQIKFIAM